MKDRICIIGGRGSGSSNIKEDSDNNRNNLYDELYKRIYEERICND